MISARVHRLYAIALTVVVTVFAAHMVDRIAFGLAMEQRGLAPHQLGETRP